MGLFDERKKDEDLVRRADLVEFERQMMDRLGDLILPRLSNRAEEVFRECTERFMDDALRVTSNKICDLQRIQLKRFLGQVEDGLRDLLDRPDFRLNVNWGPGDSSKSTTWWARRLSTLKASRGRIIHSLRKGRFF